MLDHSKKLDVASQRQARRYRAIALHSAGYCTAEIGRMLGVSREAVRQWLAAFRAGGLPALAARARAGAPPKLSRAEGAYLSRLLSVSPREHGYSFDEWTTKRIASFIKRLFGVTYHPDHIGRLMRRLRVDWRAARRAANVRAAVVHGSPASSRLPILLWGGVVCLSRSSSSGPSSRSSMAQRRECGKS